MVNQTGLRVVRGQLIMDSKETRISWVRVTEFLRLWMEIAAMGMEFYDMPPVKLKFYPGPSNPSLPLHDFTLFLTYSTDKFRQQELLQLASSRVVIFFVDMLPVTCTSLEVHESSPWCCLSPWSVWRHIYDKMLLELHRLSSKSISSPSPVASSSAMPTTSYAPEQTDMSSDGFFY